jgi:hypothetical protein
MPESKKTIGLLFITALHDQLNKSSNTVLAAAAASRDFFCPPVAFLKIGFSENQPQKFALSLSGGFSAWLSAQPDGR